MTSARDDHFQFIISDGAKEDLHFCRREDPYAAAQIAVVLREIRGDPAYVERMIDEGFSDERVEDICALWSLQDRRINGYRAKLVVVRAWRLIFVVDRQSARIGLFAVMQRDVDYSARLMDLIEREFDALGFTRY